MSHRFVAVFPDDVSGLFVESQHRLLGSAATDVNPCVVNDGADCVLPFDIFAFKFRFDVMTPNFVSGFEFETNEIHVGVVNVYHPVIDGGR